MNETTPGDRLRQQVAGVCLLAGALLMTPTTMFEYAEGRLFAAGIVGLIVSILLLPGLLEIARLLQQSMPRFSVVVGLIATVGCVAGASMQTALLHEWAAYEAGTPEAMVTAIIEVTEQQVFPALVIFSIMFPVSLLLLGIGLYMTRVTPKWVAGLLVAGAIVFPLGHIGTSQFVSHLAETLLLIPLAWISVRLLFEAKHVRSTMPAAT